MENNVRYSDEDLQIFKEIVLKKLETAQKDYDNLKNEIENDLSSSLKDTISTLQTIEDSSEAVSKETIINQINRLDKFINDLKRALLRIENKTYGICKVTGKLISKERLKVVPHATMSIEAKKNKR